MKRKILNVPLKDNDIRKKTTKGCSQTVISRWGIHVLRMKPDRWTTAATVWVPREGKRNVGRRNTRWANNLRRKLGPNWTREAKNKRLITGELIG